MLIDRFGRRINYLRLSVTNQCNLNCLYCRPLGTKQPPQNSSLSYQEIATIVHAATQLGITHFRLTGGEPLLRADLPELIRGLSSIPGVTDLSLTTNGQLLSDIAQELAVAGLQRVNVSMDSLDPDRYRLLTGGGSLQRVWAGIHASQRAGLAPVKLNVVLVNGYNDTEVTDFAQLAGEQAMNVRFIELMPIGAAAAVADTLFYPADAARRQLAPQLGYPSLAGPGPASVWQLGQGTVGFIAAISEPFCDRCNRLRVTARGTLRPCLNSDIELDLTAALGSPHPVAAVQQVLYEAVALKPKRGGYLTANTPGNIEMSCVGG